MHRTNRLSDLFWKRATYKWKRALYRWDKRAHGKKEPYQNGREQYTKWNRDVDKER